MPLLVLLGICLLGLPANAKYGGGTGQSDDPYLIYTAEQMNAIGADWKDWNKHFKLMADIDLSVYAGTDFNIIGTGITNAFSGVFDGNNNEDIKFHVHVQKQGLRRTLRVSQGPRSRDQGY
jgi:hypothetical protein